MRLVGLVRADLGSKLKGAAEVASEGLWRVGDVGSGGVVKGKSPTSPDSSGFSAVEPRKLAVIEGTRLKESPASLIRLLLHINACLVSTIARRR